MKGSKPANSHLKCKFKGYIETWTAKIIKHHKIVGYTENNRNINGVGTIAEKGLKL